MDIKDITEEIIKKAQEGDVRAFENIVCIYKPLLIYLANKYAINSSDREEMYQEGLIELWEARIMCETDDCEYYMDFKYCRDKVEMEVTNKMKEETKFCIKVNIPDSEKSYKKGYGEGVWVIMDSTFKEPYINNTKGIYYGILDNDSVYYEGLNAGTKVPVEIIGDKRPVINYDWLIKNYKLS